jgi:hypothetical protein
MLEKGVEELLPTMFGNERLDNFSGQSLHVVGDEVGYLAICGMPPGMIHDITLGRVCR